MVPQYEEIKNSQPFKSYIKGIEEGYSWANVFLEGAKQTPLYCQPKQMVVEPENSIRILDRQISIMRESNYLKPDTPVEPLLLLGLIRTFPCKNALKYKEIIPNNP